MICSWPTSQIGIRVNGKLDAKKAEIYLGLAMDFADSFLLKFIGFPARFYSVCIGSQTQTAWQVKLSIGGLVIWDSGFCPIIVIPVNLCQ